MKILIFNWKDLKNPKAGGAELVTQEIAKRFVLDGHQVTIICSNFKNSKQFDNYHGVKIIRVGNKWTVYWKAFRYYKKYLANKFDLVIDEINTVPFFAKFYVKEKNIILCFQLCRQVWFYQIIFPFNLIGYLIEPIYLWLLRKQKVLTESESTKEDLQKYGFKKNNIFIFNIGIETKPVEYLNNIKKYNNPTILSLGTIRSMKRPLHIIKAFEIARKKIPNLKLAIAGDALTRYAKKVLKYIDNSKYKDSTNYLGKVDKDQKIKLMQKSHLICVTSVKEGWGIIVTEANSQGTPAIVYNVDGLKDSVKNNQTGIICQQNNPENLAKNIVELLDNPKKYQTLRINAWQWSKEMNFERSYNNFKKIIDKNG